MTWPGYSKFWTQVVRQTMRKNDTKGIQVALHRQHDSAEVVVDTLSEFGQFLNNAQVEMLIIQPGMKQVQATLQQSAPGKYSGNFDTSMPGAYHADITVKQNGVVLYRQSRGLMVGYNDELRIRPTNEDLLRAVAANSRGISNVTPETVFDVGDARAIRPFPMWPWLLTLAAILLVLDVALRRIDFAIHRPFRSTALK